LPNKIKLTLPLADYKGEEASSGQNEVKWTKISKVVRIDITGAI
jgi:hypothetical protein